MSEVKELAKKSDELIGARKLNAELQVKLEEATDSLKAAYKGLEEQSDTISQLNALCNKQREQLQNLYTMNQKQFNIIENISYGIKEKAEAGRQSREDNK